MLSFFLRFYLYDSETKPVQLHPRECVLAEGGNLFIWGAMLYRYGWSADTILGCLLSSALLLLSIVDCKMQKIPRSINLFLLLLAVIHTVLHTERWLTYVLGFFCISSILVLVYWITSGRGVGGGDIKLMAATGMFLGWELSLWAFFVACIYACVIHGIKMKVWKAGSVLAFGPYLSAGILTAVWFADRLTL